MSECFVQKNLMWMFDWQSNRTLKCKSGHAANQADKLAAKVPTVRHAFFWIHLADLYIKPQSVPGNQLYIYSFDPHNTTQECKLVHLCKALASSIFINAHAWAGTKHNVKLCYFAHNLQRVHAGHFSRESSQLAVWMGWAQSRFLVALNSKHLVRIHDNT